MNLEPDKPSTYTPERVMEKRTITAMLVASAGGHWVQLRRVIPAFEGCELVFVTTNPDYAQEVAPNRLLTVPDASRWNKIKVILLATSMLKHILTVRPDIIISTGAAPGFFALYFGKKLKARTIWLDSIANCEQLSMSGRMAGKYADLWLTQWEHLAKPEGPQYAGAVL